MAGVSSKKKQQAAGVRVRVIGIGSGGFVCKDGVPPPDDGEAYRQGAVFTAPEHLFARYRGKFLEAAPLDMETTTHGTD